MCRCPFSLGISASLLCIEQVFQHGPDGGPVAAHHFPAPRQHGLLFERRPQCELGAVVVGAGAAEGTMIDRYKLLQRIGEGGTHVAEVAHTIPVAAWRP